MEMHSFNTNVAKQYGITCAVLLQNLYYWTEKNKANNVNFHDGYYWTYNSNKAFEELFPYLTVRQIKYALDTLEEKGLILKGNYNSSCDRTLWYAVTNKAIEIITGKKSEVSSQQMTEESVSIKNVEDIDDIKEIVHSSEEVTDRQNDEENKAILQNCQMEMTNLVNGNDKIVKSIRQNCQMEMTKLSNVPNNKQHIYTTDNKEKEIYKEKENTTDEVVSVFNTWNDKCNLKCEELSKSLQNIIKSILKTYKLEEIKLYISRYSEMYNDKEYYFSHNWSLKNFLCQRNAMKEFKDNGEKWVNYQTWKLNKPKDNCSNFIHNKYTQEQIEKCIDRDLSLVSV